MLKALFKRLSVSGQRIGAIDNRWTSCQDKDRGSIARSGIAQLNEILSAADLDSDLRDWATNLRAVMQRHLEEYDSQKH